MRAMFDQCKLDVSDSVEPADNLALSGKKWRFHTTLYGHRPVCQVVLDVM
jgi:hypothetical protein